MDRRRQGLAFGLTWLAYATYYLGRKSFSVVKKPMQSELGLSTWALGTIDTAFLAAYAAGQFASGLIGDRIGARRLVGYGMLLSAAACAAFGSASGVFVFAALFALNGLAQSSGWPGTTRSMAEWTTPANRGTVMAFWSTCYQVGGLVAVALAGLLATHYGWRAAFYVPALAVAAVGLLVLFLLPAAPSRTGRGGTTSDGGRMPHAGRAREAAPVEVAEDDAGARAERRAAQRAVLKNRTLWLYGASYFFVKLVRYALLGWLPFYLSTTLAYSTLDAARVSMAFDAGGIFGVIVLGRLSDRSKRFSRAGLSSIWLFALGFVCFVYVLVGHTGMALNAALLACMGALLFGPDALLSGAAAQDAGGPRAAALATGFVNGLGSIGALVQGLLVPAIAERFGWQGLFPALVVMSLCAGAVLLPAARLRPASP